MALTDEKTQTVSKEVASQKSESRTLAAKIIDSPSSIEGECKQVTVLFADVVDSTSRISHLSAEESVALFQPAIDIMTSAIHRYDGTVNRIQGDGIMALFGAPIAQEDHASRACHAALDMQLNIKQSPSNHLSLRIGINSGEVVVRTLLNDLSVEYEADGPAVHLAARMEQLAGHGQIRVTKHTTRLTAGEFEVHDLGSTAVRGFAEPVEQFLISRAASAASRWEIRARKGLAPFTGRDAELRTLEQSLSLASEGQGQVVALSGDAGMGKSRLIHEFLSRQTGSNWTIRVTAARSDRTESPFWPIRALVNQVIGSDSGADSSANPALQEYLSSFPKSLESARLALAALVDVSTVEQEWNALEPQERRQQLISGFKALALYRASESPLLLIFEDLHWLDTESLAALSALVDAIVASKILVLVSYRPHFSNRWASRSWHQLIQLGNLGHTKSLDLITSLIGADDSLHPLATKLVETTDGRPLFIEEIVRDLVDSGQLTGSKGDYQIGKSAIGINIPDSIQSVLAARMDRLEPDTKRILQTASILGRTVPLPLLQYMAESSSAELGKRIQLLIDSEFIYEQQSFPYPLYVFKHALTENIAYLSLLKTARSRLHSKALDAIQSCQSVQLADHLESQAHHAFLGERWSEAVVYLQKAGDLAASQSAYVQARQYFERAIQALDSLPPNSENQHLLLQLILDLRPCLGAAGLYTEILNRLEQAERLTKSLGAQKTLAAVLADKTHVLYHRGNIEEAINVGNAAVAAYTGSDRRINAQASANLSQANFFRGDITNALDIFEPYVDEMMNRWRHERIGSTATSSVLWLANRAGMLSEVGKFKEALDLGELAVNIGLETHRPFDIAVSRAWLGWLHWRMRADTDAVKELEISYSCTVDHSLDFMQAWTAFSLANALLLTGECQRSIELSQRALKLSAKLDLVSIGIWAKVTLANALLTNDEKPKAKVLCKEALDEIGTTGMHWVAPAAQHCMAKILFDDPFCNSDESMKWAADALETALLQNMKPCAIEILKDIAGHHKTLGDDKQALIVLQRAKKMEEHRAL